jgi:ribonuclease HI
MEPTQIIDFLGWRWNCAGAHITMIPKRRANLLLQVRRALQACETRSEVPTRVLAGLVGQLNFLRLQNSEAGLHLKALDAIKVRAVRATGWGGVAVMNPSASGDLKWWMRTLLHNTPRTWETPPVKATLTTDASPTGWGAELKVGKARHYAFGRWKEQQRRLTSNAKELTAVRMALAHFANAVRGLAPATVTVQSDNTTTVHIINNKRAAISLCAHLRDLLNRARQMRVDLRAIYIPGVQNDTADRLSRLGKLTGFHVRDVILTKLLEETQFHPTLDVFAREPSLWQLNKSSDRQEAAALWEGHGWLLPWSGERLFLHPPINKIARALHRLQLEPTPTLLITPGWRSQPWSPILAEMLEKEYRLGTFDSVMTTTPEFRHAGWRLPPGEVVASLLATRTMRADSSSMSSSPQ